MLPRLYMKQGLLPLKQMLTTAKFYGLYSLPLAGGTSVNAGAWCRGTNQLFSQWEAIAGPEWSVNKILSLYKGLERYHGKTNSPNARGHHGPIRIRQDSPSICLKCLLKLS